MRSFFFTGLSLTLFDGRGRTASVCYGDVDYSRLILTSKIAQIKPLMWSNAIRLSHHITMITGRVISCAPFFKYSRRLSAIGAVGSSNISDIETNNTPSNSKVKRWKVFLVSHMPGCSRIQRAYGLNSAGL